MSYFAAFFLFPLWFLDTHFGYKRLHFCKGKNRPNLKVLLR